MTAAERWQADLAEWAIPQHILEAAPASPWGFDPALFIARADAATHESTPSNERARELLPPGGSVLDVGCAAGTAALPLADVAGRLNGVDSSPPLLAAFRERAERVCPDVVTVAGRWPEVAEQTPVADVVVCHHVLYNVPDIAPFIARLTDHARVRVVVEMTATHPMSNINSLWRRFHGLERPARPTAADVVTVLQEMGLSPQRLDWVASAIGHSRPHPSRAELLASVRRRLCLTPERDAELLAALEPMLEERDGMVRLPPQTLVTVWWNP